MRTVAISGSERKPDGTYATNFAEFQDKLAAVGLLGFESLPTLLIWDVTFWDHSLWGSDELIAQARSLHDVLFPESPFDYREYCEKFDVDIEAPATDRKWRNRLCDALALWTHLHFGGGIFVTSDKNFHKPSKPESTDRSLRGRDAGLPESSAGAPAFAGRCRSEQARLGGTEDAGAGEREACAGVLARGSDPGRRCERASGRER